MGTVFYQAIHPIFKLDMLSLYLCSLSLSNAHKYTPSQVAVNQVIRYLCSIGFVKFDRKIMDSRNSINKPTYIALLTNDVYGVKHMNYLLQQQKKKNELHCPFFYLLICINWFFCDLIILLDRIINFVIFLKVPFYILSLSIIILISLSDFTLEISLTDIFIPISLCSTFSEHFPLDCDIHQIFTEVNWLRQRVETI